MKVADHYRLTSGGVFGYCRKPTFCHYVEGVGHLIAKGDSYFNTLIRQKGTTETIKICIPCANMEYKKEKTTKRKEIEEMSYTRKFRVYATVAVNHDNWDEMSKDEQKQFAESMVQDTLKHATIEFVPHTFRLVKKQDA